MVLGQDTLAHSRYLGLYELTNQFNFQGEMAPTQMGNLNSLMFSQKLLLLLGFLECL